MTRAHGKKRTEKLETTGFDHEKRNHERNRSKYWLTMVDILDTQFPKGKCKERGAALIMLTYIELMLSGMKFGPDGKPKM